MADFDGLEGTVGQRGVPGSTLKNISSTCESLKITPHCTVGFDRNITLDDSTRSLKVRRGQER